MDNKIVDLMARAMFERDRANGVVEGHPEAGWHGVGEYVQDRYLNRVRAALSALSAAGYEIRKRDPDMMEIAEVDTTRPISPRKP